MIRYLQKKKWVLVIDALKRRPDPVADEIHWFHSEMWYRTLEISRFVYFAGSEKAERLPAINIMKLVIDGYKDIDGWLDLLER